MKCLKQAVKFLVGALLFVAGCATAATAFSPEDLVGEWNGQWVGKYVASGRMSLTIKSAGEKEIAGTFYFENRRTAESYHNREVEFKGSLTKTGISGLVDGRYSLVLDVVKPDRMEGTFISATAPARVWVEKAKK